jgi:hypothetical protein
MSIEPIKMIKIKLGFGPFTLINFSKINKKAIALIEWILMGSYDSI